MKFEMHICFIHSVVPTKYSYFACLNLCGQAAGSNLRLELQLQVHCSVDDKHVPVSLACQMYKNEVNIVLISVDKQGLSVTVVNCGLRTENVNDGYPFFTSVNHIDNAIIYTSQYIYTISDTQKTPNHQRLQNIVYRINMMTRLLTNNYY